MGIPKRSAISPQSARGPPQINNTMDYLLYFPKDIKLSSPSQSIGEGGLFSSTQLNTVHFITLTGEKVHLIMFNCGAFFSIFSPTCMSKKKCQAGIRITGLANEHDINGFSNDSPGHGG